MNKYLKILTNKFVITFLAFAIFISFFDTYGIFTVLRTQNELENVNQKIDYLKKESDKMDAELERLRTSNTTLEKYAREKYHQKKESEDIYIVMPEDENNNINK